MIKKPKTIDDVIRKLDTLPTREEMNTRIDGVEITLDGKINSSIENLAVMVQEGFTEVNKNINDVRNELLERIGALEKDMKGMHQNFDAVFQELKEIRKEIKEVDTRAEVADLQIRVAKLEKKVKST